MKSRQGWDFMTCRNSGKLIKVGLGYGHIGRRFEFFYEFFEYFFGHVLLVGQSVNPCKAHHGQFLEKVVGTIHDLFQDFYGLF